MVRMNFIFIFISSSDTNLLQKKSVKQKIKKQWPYVKPINNLSYSPHFDLCFVKNNLSSLLLPNIAENSTYESYYKCLLEIKLL